MLNDPKLAKALLLRRNFAPSFVAMAALMFSGSATGTMKLSFNLGALSRNELLLHLLRAEVALQPAPLAAHLAFEVMEAPGVRFSFEVQRLLPWPSGLLLRRRLQQALKRLHMETLRFTSA